MTKNILPQDSKQSYLASFLIPYFGEKLPKYLNYFLLSCSFNPKFQFIFFTNLKDRFPPVADNVKVLFFSKADFHNLAQQKLNININIDYPFKIVDFKPAFGAVFHDYFTSPFWGHVDIDLTLGDIDFFLQDINYNSYDVLSFREEWLSGSFALYKNCHDVNFLFQRSQDWKTVFTHKKHYRFDECGIPLKKGVNIYSFLERGGNIFALQNEIESFTHVLKNREKTRNLNIFFATKIKENLKKNEIITFSSGIISSSCSNPGQHYLLYHYIGEKRKLFFHDPGWRNLPISFFMTRWGFHIAKKNIHRDIFFRFITGIFSGKYIIKTLFRVRSYIARHLLMGRIR